MMDRTGGLGTDEKERGEHVHLHFMPISVKWRGNQSGWEEEGFMISSALMDGCYLWRMIVFAAFLCRLFDILKAVDTAKTHSAMMCNSKATGGQKCDILFQQAGDVYSNIGCIPSSSKCVGSVRVHLSYE